MAGLLVCSSLRKLGISYLSGRYSLLASPGSKSEAGNHSLSHNPALLDPHLSAGTSRQVGKEELAREEQEVELELERTLDVSVSVEVWGQRCVSGLNSSRSCTRRRLCPGSPPPPPPPQSSWSSRCQSRPRSLQSREKSIIKISVDLVLLIVELNNCYEDNSMIHTIDLPWSSSV